MPLHRILDNLKGIFLKNNIAPTLEELIIPKNKEKAEKLLQEFNYAREPTILIVWEALHSVPEHRRNDSVRGKINWDGKNYWVQNSEGTYTESRERIYFEHDPQFDSNISIINEYSKIKKIPARLYK